MVVSGKDAFVDCIQLYFLAECLLPDRPDHEVTRNRIPINGLETVVEDGRKCGELLDRQLSIAESYNTAACCADGCRFQVFVASITPFRENHELASRCVVRDRCEHSSRNRRISLA